MYRRSLEMEENNVVVAKDCDFVSRVAALPIVHAVIVSTTDAYKKAKETNELLNRTLNAAEKTVYVAAERAKPVIVKLEMPIGLANNLACMTLTKLEEKVPIITKAPEEIVADTKNLYNTTIVEPIKIRYNSAKTLSLQKATSVKNYSMAKANIILDTKYGHAVVGTLDTMLIKADGYVDTYLPYPQVENKPDEPKMVNDGNPVDKAVVLSKKVGQRMCAHAQIKFQASKKRIEEILSNLHLTLNYILAKSINQDPNNKVFMDALNQAQVKILKLWEEFNKGNPDVPGDKTLEQKVFFVVSQLTAQLNKTYQKTASTLALLPSHVQPTVAAIQNYINNLYTQFADVKSWDDVSNVVVLQMRDAIKNLQVLYSQLYDNALNMRPFSWLVPDIDLRDINLFEELDDEVSFVRYISTAQHISNGNSSSEEDSVEFVMKPKWMQ